MGQRRLTNEELEQIYVKKNGESLQDIAEDPNISDECAPKWWRRGQRGFGWFSDTKTRQTRKRNFVAIYSKHMRGEFGIETAAPMLGSIAHLTGIE
jgi:hypothetical protein